MANVMYIEDEKVLRENIQEILESEGMTVQVFSDGSDALEYLSSVVEPPEVIICDINLPIVSGYEFIRRLRLMSVASSKTPVIFLSAMGQKQDIVKGLALNAADYLVKPVDFDTLIKKVKAYVNIQ